MMKNDNKKKISFTLVIICLLVLVAVLSVSECRKFEKAGEGTATDTLVVYKTDTLTIVKTDTIERIRPVLVKETIVDTMWLDKGSETPQFLPLTQRYYKGDGYEIWISGYEPVLDKITLYPKTETKYVTNTITKTIYKETYRLNASAMLWVSPNRVYPMATIQLLTPKRWGFSVGVGMDGKEMMYGGGITYRIF